jgi:hypothetical protein
MEESSPGVDEQEGVQLIIIAVAPPEKRRWRRLESSPGEI